jgi:hypothetical protein
MARDNEPMDAARKSAASSVKLALSKRNLELSQCGSSTFRETLPEFDSGTGYWAKPTSVTPKPPRWLFWLERVDGQVVARVPEAPGVDRLGFFNTAKGRVGGLFVRIVPAIRLPSGQWHLHLGWEWVLFFVMPRALKAGSSGQVVDHFRPEEGKFGYLYNTDEIDPATNKSKQEYEEPPYVAAGLFSLLPANDAFQPDEPGAQPVTYGEATAALQSLINASPLAGQGEAAEPAAAGANA